MISLSNLTLGFGKRILIRDANISITPGKLTALIGRNGSGKSTLLRAIAGLSDRYSGEIVINGSNLRDLHASQLAQLVAFVTTEKIRIENMRCEDVVALGRAPYTNWIGKLRQQDREIVRHSIAVVGIADFALRPINTLSDGERQRVMIARALAQSTPVILLDEPTSFLDLPNRFELCRLLARLAHTEGKTILYSTHELDIALKMSDEVVVIDSPRLIIRSAAEASESNLLGELFHLERYEKDSRTL